MFQDTLIIGKNSIGIEDAAVQSNYAFDFTASSGSQDLNSHAALAVSEQIDGVFIHIAEGLYKVQCCRRLQGCVFRIRVFTFRQRCAVTAAATGGSAALIKGIADIACLCQLRSIAFMPEVRVERHAVDQQNGCVLLRFIKICRIVDSAKKVRVPAFAPGVHGIPAVTFNHVAFIGDAKRLYFIRKCG